MLLYEDILECMERPLVEGEEEQTVAQPKAAPAVGGKASRILIVESDRQSLESLREMCDVNPRAYYCRNAHGMGIPVGHMDYLQGDNEMRTFAAMTGGRAYFPRFEGELPELFGDISNDIRNQYTLSYAPTNSKLDGTYRKLKVQVVGPDGGPLKVKDQKGKDLKIEVVARDGYTAKHTVD